MASNIHEQVRAAASRNAKLLQKLQETDHGPTALELQESYIQDLQSEIAETEKRISVLTRKRENEFKDHKKYQDSTVKKFAYRVGGKSEKFDKRAEKEEREYFDALQDEHNAKERKKHLDNQLHEAQTAKTNLEHVVEQNKAAQAELDSLYNSIFQGPTPSFPQEDQAEQKVNEILETYRNIWPKWDSENKASKVLQDAGQYMREAHKAIGGALSHSRIDMFGGGTTNDLMKRNSLAKAQSHISKVHMLCGQAMRLSLEVQQIPEIHIEQGHILSDVIFDNIFSDMAMHDRIKGSGARVEAGAQHLQGEIEKCQARVDYLRQALSKQEKELLDARKELQSVREQIFQEVAAAQINSIP